MSARAMVVLAQGQVPARLWVAAAEEGRRVGDRPKACVACPLRQGGDLEASARTMLADASPSERTRLRAWACHVADRPCAGMRRLLREVRR